MVQKVTEQNEQERISMSLFTAEDYEPLPPGLYVGKLSDIESRESTNGEYSLGRELKAGEQIGIEDLVGGKHDLMIENVKRDGRTFDNVSAVHKYRGE
jgi:hypothetical protein